MRVYSAYNLNYTCSSCKLRFNVTDQDKIDIYIYICDFVIETYRRPVERPSRAETVVATAHARGSSARSGESAATLRLHVSIGVISPHSRIVIVIVVITAADSTGGPSARPPVAPAAIDSAIVVLTIAIPVGRRARARLLTIVPIIRIITIVIIAVVVNLLSAFRHRRRRRRTPMWLLLMLSDSCGFGWSCTGTLSRHAADTWGTHGSPTTSTHGSDSTGRGHRLPTAATAAGQLSSVFADITRVVGRGGVVVGALGRCFTAAMVIIVVTSTGAVVSVEIIRSVVVQRLGAACTLSCCVADAATATEAGAISL